MTRKPQLLIVEDEPAIRNGLIDVFVYHGYDVDACADGESGQSKALSGRYDLVLLAVAHRQFAALGADGIRSFLKPGGLLYDLKYIAPDGAADARL